MPHQSLPPPKHAEQDQTGVTTNAYFSTWMGRSQSESPFTKSAVHLDTVAGERDAKMGMFPASPPLIVVVPFVVIISMCDLSTLPKSLHLHVYSMYEPC